MRLRLNGIELVTEFQPGSAGCGRRQSIAASAAEPGAERRAGDARRPLKRLQVGARFDDKASAVELFIKDTGHGIDRANLSRIFDPFFTTRDVGEGTGLGLSICYGIVRDHGGQITVDSAVNAGTTFSLSLPARVDEDGPGTRFSSRTPSRGNAIIWPPRLPAGAATS